MVRVAGDHRSARNFVVVCGYGPQPEKIADKSSVPGVSSIWFALFRCSNLICNSGELWTVGSFPAFAQFASFVSRFVLVHGWVCRRVSTQAPYLALDDFVRAVMCWHVSSSAGFYFPPAPTLNGQTE